MANYRISDLTEKLVLDSDGAGAGTDDNALILLARSGSHNEKIKYIDFKKTLTDRSVYVTGDQTVSGKKTFADEITFLDRVNIHTIVDTTQAGDISGNVFVGESGLFETVGIGTPFLNRDGQPQYTLHVSGNTFFDGDVTITGTMMTLNMADLNVTGNVSISGTLAMADGEEIITDKVRARDSDGLYLVDDSNNGIFVQDGGNIGIGTSMPQAELDVSGFGRFGTNIPAAIEIQGAQIKQVDGENDLTISAGIGDGKLILRGGSNDGASVDISDAGNNSALFVDTYTKKVGIGENFKEPQHALHVSGDTMLSGNAYVSGRLGIGTTTPSGWLHINNDDDSMENLFLVEDSAHPDSTPFVVTSGGSVGIGTINPTYALDTRGTIRFYNDATAHYPAIVGTTNEVGLNFANSQSNWTLFLDDSPLDEMPAGGLGFHGGNTPTIKMVLDDDGKLTIGSVNPLGTFNVTGSAYLEDAYATGSDGEWGRLLPSTTSAPPSAGGPGTPGQTAYDNNYFYVCVTTDTWKRTPLATW